MKRRRAKKVQPVSKVKKRLIMFTIRLCCSVLILSIVMLCNLFSDYTAVLVRKTLGESTDPAQIKEYAVTTFMQYYESYREANGLITAP